VAGRTALWIHRFDVLAALLGACWTVAFLRLSLLQFETGHNLSFDLAMYARSLWGIAHGMPVNPFRDQHALALHSHFILYALAPLARPFSSVHVLLALQALSLGAGGLVLYAIAVSRLNSRVAALAIAFAYYLNPLITNTALFDMHPKTLAIIPVLLALHILDRDPETFASLAKGAGLVLLAFTCREDTALCFFLVGVCWFLVLRRFRAGAVLAVLGAALFCGYQFLLRPSLGYDFASFDAHFGGSGGVLQAIDREDAIYLLGSLAGFAFLPVLGPRFAIGAAVPLLASVLSQFPGTNTLQSHYGFLIVPFFAMGAVAGLERLRNRVQVTRGVLVAMTGATLALHVVSSSAPGGSRFVAELYANTPATAGARECLARIPDGASALAPVFLAAHLVDRPLVRTFFGPPDRVLELDYVLLESDPVPELQTARGYEAYIGKRHGQRETLVREYGYMEVARCHPFVVLARAAHSI
jgi:uncharacterized membrane protein